MDSNRGMSNHVVSDLEKERRTAIFVMQNFVPEEQRRGGVDLEFLMQQLRRSPLQPRFGIRTCSENPESTSTSAAAIVAANDNDNDKIEMDENSDEWQDLMQWSNPSLLDTIESRPVHLFQWERTYRFLVELMAGLKGTVAASPRLEMQRKEISKFIHLLRENKNKGRMKVQTSNHNVSKPTNVCWIVWKLRGFLATIPTPVTQATHVTAHVRLLKFHEELGIIPFTKLNQWIVKNPDHYLMYLATVCWFPEPPPPPRQPEAQNS